MKDLHKNMFRQRPVDNAKPLNLIKSINSFIKSADSSENGDMESEINKILELYDKKKTIVIPKAEKIEKPNEAPSNNSVNNFNSGIKYNQSEYIRPHKYVLYQEANRKEPKQKDYEASLHDINFLNFENNFMTLEELEKVISALENDIGTGEQIPTERITEIIVSRFPKVANHANKLTMFFLTRREDHKKSLLRKYWKEQKTTDKFLMSTFRRREKEKMKTRRNKQNEFESLEKMKEIKECSEGSLRAIINLLKGREEWKKNLIITNDFLFQEEVSLIKGNKSDLSKLDEKWQVFSKEIGKMQLNDEKDKEKDKDKDREKEKKIKQIDTNNDNTSFISTNGKLDKQDIVKENQYRRPIRQKNKKMKTEKSEPVTPSKIRPIVETVVNTVPIIKKEEQPKERMKETLKKELKEKKKEKIKVKEVLKEPDVFLKLRLRRNRANQLVIDRYIQKKDSFSPFDDSITKEMNSFRILNEDFIYSADKEANFDDFYGQYLKEEMKDICLISDSEDDGVSFQNQIKNFQNSHRQFLKQKRGHN